MMKMKCKNIISNDNKDKNDNNVNIAVSLSAFLSALLLFTFSSLVFTTVLPVANAKPPHYNYKLLRGVKKMYYWLHPDAVPYTSKINAAVNDWMMPDGANNPIVYAPVSSNYATDTDFYAVPKEKFEHPDMVGITRWYGANGEKLTNENTGTPTANWFFANIALNKDKAGQNYFGGSIRHEIGHAMGLAHTLDKKSIMCQVVEGRSVNTVQKGDSDAIVDRYGW